MAKYLVVANAMAESRALRAAVSGLAEQDRDAEFVVLVPITPTPALLGLFGEAKGTPLALARRRARRARQRLESVGARCLAVRLGSYDPLQAIEDELRYQDFRAVIVSTLPHPVSHWLHLDLPCKLARRHPEVDVYHVAALWHLAEDPAGRAMAPVRQD